MSVESVSTNNAGKKVAKAAGIGAIVGASVSGGLNYACQKKILAQGDTYIKQKEGEVTKQMRFCTPFFKGTQEAADIAKQALQNQLEQFKQFVKNGKVNFGQVAKQAGIGALIAGAAWAGLAALIQLFKKQGREYVQQNAKILAEELNNAQK